jgi:tetrapyrrole methylase family protein / MazG family protein
VSSSRKVSKKSRAKARPKPGAPGRLPSLGTRAKSAWSSPRIPLTARDKRAGEWFAKLVALQGRLRGPQGCPWDAEQTHQSLRKFLIEETYEVLDAMESSDPRKFASELGDLLLQVVFHSVLAEETGAFTMSDVVQSIHEKMVRRHPHVFDDTKAKDSAAVLKNWEQIKAEERAEFHEDNNGGQASRADKSRMAESILAGVPRSLPAMLEAYQLTRRASHIGFDWDSLTAVFDKLDEERREIFSLLNDARISYNVGRPGEPIPMHLEEEVGDLLFVAVNVARFLGVDPEIALKKANRKFLKRFEWMESAAAAEGRRLADLPRERMEALWDLSKSQPLLEESRAAETAK